MNRRSFLQRSAAIAGAVCLDFPAFAEKVKTFGEPRLKIGILSDVHIRYKEDTKYFEKALKYFRDNNVDGVLVAGDIADWALESQLKWFADTWYSVFPKDKAPDGHRVEKLFIYGNHDIKDAKAILKKYKVTREQAEAEAIGPRRAEIWKKLFKEKWAPIYMKDVKGYKFIGGHFTTFDGINNLQEFLDSVKSQLPTDKPFFYFQHMHPKDTCSAPWTWGQDDGKTTAALSKYPNVISFSGHSHTPLTDEKTIWQGAFTSVGTASLSYVIPFGGRENSTHTGDKSVIHSQMKKIDTKDGKHGQLMTVYSDHITLERREFVYDQQLADNWIINLPYDGDCELSFERRAKTAPVPQFSSGSKVTTTRAMGKDRQDKEEDQITVHFPSVLKKTMGTRAFEYEIQAEIEDYDTCKIMSTKRVFSKGFYLSEDKDEDEVICPFAVSELAANKKVRFYVRPVNSFGKMGEPICSDWVSTAKPKKA